VESAPPAAAGAAAAAAAGRLGLGGRATRPLRRERQIAQKTGPSKNAAVLSSVIQIAAHSGQPPGTDEGGGEMVGITTADGRTTM
jgi:hypothetical protein